ncbi:Calcium-binding EF-hand [Quillaja saponaria]|uniref:Calcium-binding EF-hand n=1 Tax=Quillaja saponaria TaxID=32244 RepID=A0AAD7KMT5_QUISA|nr:Calcium-binding EF-hand [Quillaja saponaria]
MALKSRSVTSDGKRVMTMEEFKRWLKKFDADKDGQISKSELREAIHATGGRFGMWKSRRGIRAADANGNGFIDDGEMNNLVEFAEKHLGVRIVQF